MEKLNESFEYVKEFLDNKGIKYQLTGLSVLIFANGYRYNYYYGSGKWHIINPILEYPKIYSSLGIEQFYDEYINLNHNVDINVDDYFSDITHTFNDDFCNEPIMVARKMKVKHIPSTIMTKLKNDNMVIYVSGHGWVFIEEKITREDAIEKYGEITKEEHGYNGNNSWKSVTFGKTRFTTPLLKII